MKAENLWPVTYYDFVPVLRSTYPILGIWGYITLACFVGAHFMKRGPLWQYSKKARRRRISMNTRMVGCVVGSIGYTVAQRIPSRFFNAVKLITLMGTLDRLESALLSVWVVSDFIVISFFARAIMNVTKSLFQVSETKYLASPIILLGYAGSQLFASNRFELEVFSSTVGLSGDIVLLYLVPAVIFAIGKLRKKI